MNFLKHYDRRRFQKRYRRYRIFFSLSCALFFLCTVLEMILFGCNGRSLTFSLLDRGETFRILFTSESLFFFLSFLLGVTLYAPFFQFLFSAVRGALCGYILSAVFLSAGERGILFALCVFFYSLLSSALFFSYTSFCSMVALRLYTDGILGSFRGEERRMFGGTLFNSSLFCNTVNLRFLAMYLLLFCLSLALLAGLCFLFSLVRGLLL